jgi:nitroreductase
MELSDVMRTTAAVRAFTDEPIPAATLHRVLDDARFAPSGGNQQGWHVIVVRDRDLRRRLADLSEATWTRYLAEQVAGYRAFNPVEPAPSDVAVPDGLPRHPLLEHVETVPEVLVVTVDLRVLAVTDRDLDRCSVVGGASVYPFVHNLLLAARNQGLGGVLTTFLAASEPEAAPLLGLPDHQAVVAMVGLGTPVHQPTRLRRRPVEAFTTVDRFDGPPLDPTEGDPPSTDA